MVLAIGAPLYTIRQLSEVLAHGQGRASPKTLYQTRRPRVRFLLRTRGPEAADPAAGLCILDPWGISGDQEYLRPGETIALPGERARTVSLDEPCAVSGSDPGDVHSARHAPSAADAEGLRADRARALMKLAVTLGRGPASARRARARPSRRSGHASRRVARATRPSRPWARWGCSCA